MFVFATVHLSKAWKGEPFIKILSKHNINMLIQTTERLKGKKERGMIVS